MDNDSEDRMDIDLLALGASNLLLFRGKLSPSELLLFAPVLLWGCEAGYLGLAFFFCFVWETVLSSSIVSLGGKFSPNSPFLLMTTSPL